MADFKVLISQEEIETRIKEIANQIDQDYQGKKVTLICILKGAFIFLTDLVRNINKNDIIIEFMAVSSYGNEKRSSGKIKIIKDVDRDLTDEHIIIVEDIVDTGLTIDFLIKYFNNKGVASVKTCSLLDKAVCRKIDVPVDYSGFTIEDRFVIGYGLDLAQEYRNLPYVAEIKED
ncbi:MAG: hypoxanthine phosphoribosyltransferase [Candidatus Muiribacterium halophilum]|mgnify:CR=1 FL=1|uniref:Hypoxanthine phosphoribosyltransferase n=1 Tax=Muiribacterium halophilum TaxID=2053465 RepID=A0A2N5ZBX6_MUIH1|nr:MAG: hypoxanthine phosphoribosyltransferase [Candidatus Muirbacterium halophilum]